MSDFVQVLLLVSASVIFCCIANPYVILTLLPLFAGFVRLRRWYMASSLEVCVWVDVVVQKLCVFE